VCFIEKHEFGVAAEGTPTVDRTQVSIVELSS
jgi:hypothetical protein